MIQFLSNNLVDTASISASTENAQYPLTNLQHDFRTKVYRSTTNADTVVFDLGSTEDIDSVALVDNWRNGFGVSTVTIEANATDSWGAPAFSTTLALDTTFGIGIKQFTQKSYRYWRLSLTSTLGYCELAYVFIGKAVAITTNGLDYGFAYKNNDIKKVATTRYGQEYIDAITTQKEINSLSLTVMNTTEIDQIFEVYDNRGTVKPFIVKIGDGTNTILNNENRLNGLFKLKSAPSVKIRSGVYWDVSLSVKESM